MVGADVKKVSGFSANAGRGAVSLIEDEIPSNPPLEKGRTTIFYGT
jgi:hypothetical protein